MKVFKSMIDVYTASTEKCIDFFEQVSQKPQKELTVDEYLQLIYCKNILEQKNLVAKNDFLSEVKIKWSPVAIKESGTVSNTVFQIILMRKTYEDFSEAVKKLPDAEVYTFIDELIQKDPQELIKRDVECFDRVLNHKVGKIILSPVRMIDSESLRAIEDFINMQPSWNDSVIKEEIRGIKEEVERIRDSMDVLKDSLPSVTFGNNTEEIERRLREVEEQLEQFKRFEPLDNEKLREIEEQLERFEPLDNERLSNLETRINDILFSIRKIEERVTMIEERKPTTTIEEKQKDITNEEDDEEEEVAIKEDEEEETREETKKKGLIDRISSIPMKYAVAMWIAVFFILMILLMVVKK